MSADRTRVLAELPLPLAPDADMLEALSVAVAVEDGCDVVLPDEAITVRSLGGTDAIRAVLAGLASPS